MTEYKCPNCGGKIEVWGDIDATLKYQVKPSGELSERKITGELNGDSRYGIDCTNCDWKMHCQDDGSEIYSDLFESLDDSYAGLALSAKRI